ncbi:urea ABC transporter permease subunit UrtC [Ammoniphilus sp. YIM 78166]|uniref:urea ABC transporter permease subunit UrtC n=1 Tax=Ammoniphilus sp. YIM 78166 TaxID=1644106 RepID=UPI00106FEF34
MNRVFSFGSRGQWLAYAAVVLVLMHAPLFLSEFRLNLLGKFLSFAILAIGISMIWGYTGILSLGHGVYFGLGAYCMAMYLKLESSGGRLPDFMEWSGLTELPWFWKPFSSSIFALAAAVIVPVALAALLGYLTFRNRIRGVYFSIISQALVIIFVTLFIGKQELTGGTNGLTNFSTLWGLPIASTDVQRGIYWITLATLAVLFVCCSWLIHSRLGRVLIAIRDGENRVRFTGFNPTVYKVFVYCLSAALAGIAGVLFVLQVGIISPAMMGIIPSIEMVLWVAVGGRQSLSGAVLGAVLTNSAKSYFSESYPEIWSIFLGALFVIIVLFLPNGIVGMVEKLRDKFSLKREGRSKDEKSAHTVVS